MSNLNLYHVHNFPRIFGAAFLDPEEGDHAEKVLIAHYPKTPVDGDGQSVHVYCTLWPAAAFSIVAFTGINSVGHLKQEFILSTGAGRGVPELTASIAKSISEGMLSLESPT